MRGINHSNLTEITCNLKFDAPCVWLIDGLIINYKFNLEDTFLLTITALSLYILYHHICNFKSFSSIRRRTMFTSRLRRQSAICTTITIRVPRLLESLTSMEVGQGRYTEVALSRIWALIPNFRRWTKARFSFLMDLEKSLQVCISYKTATKTLLVVLTPKSIQKRKKFR